MGSSWVPGPAGSACFPCALLCRPGGTLSDQVCRAGQEEEGPGNRGCLISAVQGGRRGPLRWAGSSCCRSGLALPWHRLPRACHRRVERLLSKDEAVVALERFPLARGVGQVSGAQTRRASELGPRRALVWGAGWGLSLHNAAEAARGASSARASCQNPPPGSGARWRAMLSSRKRCHCKRFACATERA